MEFDPLKTRTNQNTEPPRDTDLGYDSPHHTIGNGPTQAASGKKLKDLQRRVDMLEAAAKRAGWTL